MSFSISWSIARFPNIRLLHWEFEMRWQKSWGHRICCSLCRDVIGMTGVTWEKIEHVGIPCADGWMQRMSWLLTICRRDFNRVVHQIKSNQTSYFSPCTHHSVVQKPFETLNVRCSVGIYPSWKSNLLRGGGFGATLYAAITRLVKPAIPTQHCMNLTSQKWYAQWNARWFSRPPLPFTTSKIHNSFVCRRDSAAKTWPPASQFLAHK